MAEPTVSVVVASRGRPDWLRRCLVALGQLDYSLYEVIVVACPAGAAVAQNAMLPVSQRVVPFDRANLSEARNLGIARARGALVAFIDDDAVPEPTWLSQLSAVFEDGSVAQAGGTTLGRNGISTQHGAALVTPGGVTLPLPSEAGAPRVILPKDNGVPRLHGTNMILRRDVLLAHGGFDPRFAFYLDETDLTMRIAQDGGATMFVPKALVHHGVAESATRDADRTPKDLYEIGASAGVFHSKHLPGKERGAARDAFFAERRAWLETHLAKGTLMQGDIVRLTQHLRSGYAEGSERPPKPVPSLAHDLTTNIPAKSPNVAEDLYMIATRATRTRCDRLARVLVSQGHRVTLFDLTPTTLFHKVRFTEGGYWLHTGGIFGREVRSEPLWQWSTRHLRVTRTLTRLAGIRASTPLTRVVVQS